MSYTPAQRRQNLIYAACHRWVRERYPGVYRQFIREARREVPVGRSGRRARVVLPPAPTIPVPVMKFSRPMKLLRPMKRRGD
jgi:hypothetical protein